MSKAIPASVTRLIDEFSRLPGVGPKTAARLTYYLLRTPDEHAAGALPGSKLVPLGAVRARADEIPHDKRVVAYCKSSLRAWDVVPGADKIVVINQPAGAETPVTAVIGLRRLLAEAER